MSHTAITPATRDRGAWLPPALRVVGLIATLATIAALEYGAGTAAGWGFLAYGVPLAIDSFVLGVLLSPRSRLADRLFALALVESTVVVSAVWGDHGKDAKVLLGAALATALVAALWRQDETIRRERAHADQLAEQTARADTAEAKVRMLESQAAEATDTAAQVTADAAAASAVRDAHAATIDTLRGELDRASARADAAEARALAAEVRRHGDDSDRRPARPNRAAVSTTTDDDRRKVIRAVLLDRPDAGRRPIAKAIADAGHTAGGNDRLGELVDEVRAQLVHEGHHMAAVPAAVND